MTATHAAFGHDMVRTYNDIAPAYDHLHRRWLRLAGGEAQAALEAAVRMAMTPSATLLDAGCGTGQFARRLLADGVMPQQITLADPSRAMLARCADLPIRRSLSRLEDLPFQDRAYDIVTCAWALETVPDPVEALQELCRVLRPQGVLCLTFCADRPPSGLMDWFMRRALTRRGTGRFLRIGHVQALLENLLMDDVRVLPTAGPAATLIARRSRG